MDSLYVFQRDTQKSISLIVLTHPVSNKKKPHITSIAFSANLMNFLQNKLFHKVNLLIESYTYIPLGFAEEARLSKETKYSAESVINSSVPSPL